MLESYISQLDNVTQVYQNMKARLLWNEKDKQILKKKKTETNFTKGKEKMNSLVTKSQK